MNMSRWPLKASQRAIFLLLCGIPAFAQFLPNRYTVILEDPPVSARFTSREEMRNTPAEAYRQQIETKQAAVRQEMVRRNFKITGSTSDLLNAIFVTTTSDRLAELQSIPGVLGVRPMRLYKATLNKATQLMNAPAAWNLVGGQGNAGSGMKIGIIDTGIDQTHPAFQDSSLAIPAGFPKCTTGHPEDCAYTNNKVIVARSYVRDAATAYITDPTNPAAQSIPDDYSPRDRVGHGTATASAAAGNTNTGAVTFTGMAPKAYLGNYKVQGSPGVNDGADDQSLIDALTDAVSDGMDVVSLSIGGIALTGALDVGPTCGNPAGVPCDPVAFAYEAAAKAGMVIAAAAGNDGSTAFNNGEQYPYFDSISSPASAPSVIGVGATTNSHVFVPSVSANPASAPSSVKGLAAQLSDSIFAPSFLGANAAPLVDVTKLGNDGYACTSLPAFSLNGAYALIERGPTASPCSFFTKSSNAQLAGAVGIIFYMADSSTTIQPSGMDCNTGSCFIGPVVMIANSDGLALKNYIDANPGQLVTIDTAGIEQDLATFSQLNGISPPLAANQLASYSSFGPTPDGAIKPDLVATGGFDAGALGSTYGMYLAAQNYDPNGEVYSTNRYVAADGTSFSTPIVAGAAALVKQAHPSYTAAQIKSALVNPSVQDVTTDDFGDTVDVEWLGAGRLDAGAAASTTVTAEPSTLSFGFGKAGAVSTSKAITITNKGSASVTLAVTVTANTKIPGATVAVDKPTITLAAGAAATLNVSLSGTLPSSPSPVGSYSGAVTLAATGISVRLPYLFLVGDGVPYNIIPLSLGAQGTPGSDGGSQALQVVDQFGVPVAGVPTTFSISPRGSVTFQSVTGEPACSPANSTTSTVCNTDNYGIAWAEVILGSQTGIETITVTAARTPFQGGVFILPQPTIKATSGVVNAANFQGPVAPGSYITIFGSNMVDTDVLTNATGDSETTPILPLSLDAVTVSFDVPSKGISVPGYLTFASPGQINLQMPWELQGQGITSVQIKVIMDEEFGFPFFGNVVTVPMADYSPAFFVGNNIVAAINATQGNIVTATTPVHAGDVVELFANGLGPVNNQPPSGSPAPSSPLATTKTQPTVTIGGTAANVSFSGLAPGFPGLYQVNVTIPAGVAAGTPNISVSIGGQTSTAATIPLK
jgi:uncharacterized protein (TIGR03437 family)